MLLLLLLSRHVLPCPAVDLCLHPAIPVPRMLLMAMEVPGSGKPLKGLSEILKGLIQGLDDTLENLSKAVLRPLRPSS